MGEESKDLQDQMEELDDIHENLGNQAEEMRLKVASSAYKAAKQAQCIRLLSKENRGRIVSVASSASWLWRYSSYSPAENRRPLRLHGVQLGCNKRYDNQFRLSDLLESVLVKPVIIIDMATTGGIKDPS